MVRSVYNSFTLVSCHLLLLCLVVTMATPELHSDDMSEDAAGASTSGGLSTFQACFPPGTPVILANHSAIPIESVLIGMRVARGGVVRATLQLDGRGQEMYVRHHQSPQPP